MKSAIDSAATRVFETQLAEAPHFEFSVLVGNSSFRALSINTSAANAGEAHEDHFFEIPTEPIDWRYVSRASENTSLRFLLDEPDLYNELDGEPV